jgi:hypothetical protein
MPEVPARDSSWQPARLVAAALASILALTWFAAGCGSSGKSTTTASLPKITSLHDLLVTRARIEAAGTDTPSRALLRWWRALQLRDITAARRAYARSADIGRSGTRRPSLRDEIRSLSDSLRRSRPEILDVVETPDAARVSAVINAAVFLNPTTVLLVRQTPASFRLKREAGRWKLANDDYLTQRLEAKMAKSGPAGESHR